MKKDLFYIGRFGVHGYGLMIGIGFILALFLGEYRAKKKGMKEEAIIDLAIIAAVGGFLGAKILYIIVSLKEFLQNPLAVIGSEGFVVYGGIISGVLCCMLYCKVKKLNSWIILILLCRKWHLHRLLEESDVFLQGVVTEDLQIQCLVWYFLKTVLHRQE